MSEEQIRAKLEDMIFECRQEVIDSEYQRLEKLAIETNDLRYRGSLVVMTMIDMYFIGKVDSIVDKIIELSYVAPGLLHPKYLVCIKAIIAEEIRNGIIDILEKNDLPY